MRIGLERLVAAQARRPRRWLLLALLSAVLAAALASRLPLRPNLRALLPDDRRSIQVARDVESRLPTGSVLAVVVHGPAEALPALQDRVAEALEEAAIEDVAQIDRGPDAATFFAEHGWLYLSTDDLREAAREVKRRYDEAVLRETGLLLDEASGPIDEDLRRRIDRHPPRGRYLDEARGLAVVLVHTPVGPGDLDRRLPLVDAVRRALAPIDAPIELAGNLITGAEAYDRIRADLAHVGGLGVLLVASVVLLFFLRLRALFALLLTVGVGTAWTFAFAYLAVGHLDASTGFLFAIVVGNGINPGIVVLASYLEHRGEAAPAVALRQAVTECLPVTFVASSAAAVAYGSLLVTSFRGLHHFGRIGGAGMLLCWLATALVMPPLLLCLERLSPLRPHPRSFALARPAAALALRRPRALLAVAALATALSFAGAIHWIADGPLEYDLRQIDNAPADAPTAAQRLAPVLDDICGRQSQDGIAIATAHLDQVRPLQARLEARRAAASPPPFERVVTIFDLLPEGQATKVEIAQGTRSLLDRAHAKGFLDAETWAWVEAHVPRRPRPLTIDDLPPSLARPFIERDGTRGRLVYVVPAEGESIWDGRYLLRWAESIRRVELPDGSVVEGSGRSVIFADMVAALVVDTPRAIAASALATLLLLVLAHRRRRTGGIVAALLLGLVWTAGLVSIGRSGPEGIAGVRLSFLNVVALPITVGVGADYAVNVARRISRADLAGSLTRVAGPVLLCSLTTTLGYGALIGSVNRAIASFGFVAAAGEICCLVAAVWVLPAWLKSRGSGSPTPGSPPCTSAPR